MKFTVNEIQISGLIRKDQLCIKSANLDCQRIGKGYIMDGEDILIQNSCKIFSTERVKCSGNKEVKTAS